MYTPVWRRFLPAECAIVISKPKGRKKCATDAKSGKTRERCDSMYRMRYAQLSGWWIIWICCRYTRRGVCVFGCVGVCGCNIYIHSLRAPTPKRENPNKWRVWWRLLIYRVLFIKRERWDVCEMYLFRRCK